MPQEPGSLGIELEGIGVMEAMFARGWGELIARTAFALPVLPDPDSCGIVREKDRATF
jgi:hypothetical protein